MLKILVKVLTITVLTVCSQITSAVDAYSFTGVSNEVSTKLQYEFKPIKPFGGYYLFPQDINHKNIVVGVSDTENGVSKAFIKHPNNNEIQPLLDKTYDECASEAVAINNNNMIIGNYMCGYESKAFVLDYTTQKLNELHAPKDIGGGYQLSVSDINDKGLITGGAYIFSTSEFIPIVWITPYDPQTFEDTFREVQEYSFSSINEKGDITGMLKFKAELPNNAFRFNYYRNELTILNSTDEKGVAAYANDINDSGDVVGSVLSISIVDTQYPVVWRGIDNSMYHIPLPTTKVVMAEANSVNNEFEIVGTFYTDEYELHAFYNSSSDTYDLNEIAYNLPKNAVLSTSRRINDTGTIIGIAQDRNSNSYYGYSLTRY